MKNLNSYYTKKTISSLFIITFALNAIFFSKLNAEDKVLNVYTARHYNSDKKIYKKFTKKTGIQIREISSKDQALLERLKSEGSASPADIIILADAARLWRAENSGFFQQLNSDVVKLDQLLIGGVNEDWPVDDLPDSVFPSLN